MTPTELRCAPRVRTGRSGLALMLGFGAVIYGLSGCRSAADPRPPRPERPPNVLFVAVDDLRPELRCYGVEHAVTPNLDRLAETGVRFASAHCQSGVCNPSRASVMTGRLPEDLGVLDLSTDLRKVCPDAITLPQHLRAHGYRTESVGKIYHNIFPDEPSWDLRHYVDGFPFDPDAVYVGDAGKEEQARRLELRKSRGRLRKDRFGHDYVKAQATESEDVEDSAYYDGAQTDWASARLANLAERDQPFFLAVGYYRPHLPFNAPTKYWDLYDADALPLPSTKQTRDAPTVALNRMRELRGYADFTSVPDAPATLPEAQRRRLYHGYLASVSYVDAQIGRLLERLDALGLRDNTIVVVWSDHGWKLGEHGSFGKMTNYENDTRVPLLVRAPGQASGAVVEGLVELVDVFPTLCALCGVALPMGGNQLAGQSFAAQLQNPDLPTKRTARSIYLRSGIWLREGSPPAIGRAVRTDRYRYVEWRHEDGGSLIGSELYDHENDPGEWTNLATRAATAPIRKRFARLVAARSR